MDVSVQMMRSYSLVQTVPGNRNAQALGLEKAPFTIQQATDGILDHVSIILMDMGSLLKGIEELIHTCSCNKGRQRDS